jgi:hypothetical protein
LKGAWVQPLSPSSEFLVSKFAFKWVNLCRYAAGPAMEELQVENKAGQVYKTNAVDP